MSEHDLDELLTRIPVPAYDVRDDVVRGRTALRRRQVTASAAGLVLTATVGVALVLQGGGRAAAPPYAGDPSPAETTAAPTPSPTPSPEEPVESFSPPSVTVPPDGIQPGQRFSYETSGPILRQWRDVLAEHLGDRVRYAQNSQTGGDSLGSKYDWAGGGMLELMVGSRWDDISGFTGVDPSSTEPTTFRGLEARTFRGEQGDLMVSVKHEDGTVASLYASTSFGNNGTSTDSLGLTMRDLLVAAADPRLRLPD